MKQKTQKQYAGLWLDNENALIITQSTEGEPGDYSVKEKIKSGREHGGGSEHSMNNTKQADTLKYFKNISAQLLNFDEILIFGPGKLQEQFHNHLKEVSQFRDKQITIDSAEQLTDRQMIATVKDFFKPQGNHTNGGE